MRINGSATVAVGALVVGSLVPTALAGSSDNRVQKPQQSTTSAARDLGPTWKTFSTTVGRGTKIVVSKTGNITSFVSPNVGAQTYEHIGVGAVGEGYVLCYDGQAPNYDLGSSTSGFAPATSTTSAVTRNTLDGKASLIQNFGLTVGGPGSPTTFQVQMTVNNRTSSALSNVIVRRQVDFDIDTGGAAGWAGFLSNHTRTKGSVSAFHDPAEAPSGKESHGIMMMLHQPAGTWETRITNSILDPSCNPTAAPLAANYVARGDYGDTIIFSVGTIPAGGSKTVALRYMRY